MTSATARVGEALRLRGRVAELSLPSPARWQLRIGRRSVQRTASGWVALDHEGGRVRIDVSSTAELIGPAAEEDGRLGELAARAGLPDDLGPPELRARLSLIAPRVGGEIAVQGEVTAVEGDVTTVRAALVACGASAGELMDAVIARRRVRDREPRRSASPLAPLAAGSAAGAPVATSAPALVAVASAARWAIPVALAVIAALLLVLVLAR